MVTWEPVSSNPLHSIPEIFTIAVHFSPTNFGLGLGVCLTVCDRMAVRCSGLGLGLVVLRAAPVCPSTGAGVSLKMHQWSLNLTRPRLFVSA